jgi:hypothetical protein
MELPMTTAAAGVKFHLSLNVTDLGKAVAFYRVLFDTEPAKCHDDYAKVPARAEVLGRLTATGFVGLQVTKLTDRKGPFARATADGGWVFPRGLRVAVPAAVWQQLRLGPTADQFLFLEPGAGCGRGDQS